jgi:hypothetical protein
MKLPSLEQFLRWFDNYGLVLLTGFLIAFIPLYPKIPFFSPIEQYNVRVRIEDVFVLLTFLFWIWQWWRKKVTIHPIATGVIISYLVVGLLSVVSAVFVIKTVPIMPMHLGKTLLHYFRYIEYFTLFFIAYSAITSKRHVKYLFAVLALTVLGIAIYGYGQRYFYWPVYSTMNREFSKGIRLYLTEHARVQSTFAGHYDLAAYLVIALPLILALAFEVKPISLKIALHAIHWSGVWLLVVSASRTSFAAYLAAVGIVILLHGLRQVDWPTRIRWTFTRGLVVGLVVSITMLTWGQDMYERFLQVLEGYPVVYQTYNQLLEQKKNFIATTLPGLSEFKGFPGLKGEMPEGAISTDEAEEQNIIVPSDQRPVKDKPSDVYVDVPDLVEVEVATISASGSATTVTIVEERERVFSECAKQRGLSLCIRLETLWPQAVAGFMRNPLFGSGYATLNKQKVTDFVEADSTDNNFLRTLGETGLLGFITFYSLVVVGLYYAIRGYLSQDTFLKTIAAGYIAGSLGLLINAIYIDVYASSKVAFTYWALTGLLLAYVALDQKVKSNLEPSSAHLTKAPVRAKKPAPTKTAKRKKSTKAKSR